ncbi:MAG: RNA 2',3'-cyclic phosphodiesterase [Bacteroidota bacterium]|nr:RNA 2',3'-cyclic phosphodiesterase [Bacteroidota bacterium]
MKRLFIGLPIESEKAVETVETWRKNIALNRNLLKWVDPENWHITLIFLGGTPESAVALLQQLVEESFSGIESYGTELSGVGVFPSAHNPKVLWLGLENIQPMMSAYIHMGELLQQNGFSIENKPFKPHLTLARVKILEHRISFDALLNQYRQFSFGRVGINRVVLYESITSPGGPVYKPLFVKELEK